ncbi:RNA polymerase sigma factor [Streptomyces caniscabiei]|uniref:RNA polymerase sigma factor n=1 Tax=Streptomyces caniscabiei TaxID=2746961 RepID=UPI000765CFCE|nr:sigma-70 family RNA polymerase sigma factor [Streptomyces caniscabiei]
MAVPEDSGAHGPGLFRELDALQGIHYEVPPGLDTFYGTYVRAHGGYATKVLGDKEAADGVVRTLYAHLAPRWNKLQHEEGGPEAYAWRVLKLLVGSHDRLTTMPAAGSLAASPSADDRDSLIHDAVRATLWGMRSELAAADSPLGLYTAISALPERQFDVVILHYVMGYTCDRIADIMGITVCTVRSHRRKAHNHLAAKLHSQLRDDREKE